MTYLLAIILGFYLTSCRITSGDQLWTDVGCDQVKVAVLVAHAAGGIGCQSPHNNKQGAIQVLRNAIFLEIGPPPPRNANNIEHYTFVTLFSRKSDTPHPHLRYVTLDLIRFSVHVRARIYNPTIVMIKSNFDSPTENQTPPHPHLRYVTLEWPLIRFSVHVRAWIYNPTIVMIKSNFYSTTDL